MDSSAAVISTQIGFFLFVEFHARQDDPQRLGASRVHHCLLRTESNFDTETLLKNSQSLADILNRFRFLETVVFEAGARLEATTVQSLLEALRKACRVEVQHRTYDEGHKLALQAKKSSSWSSDMGLLSPFWCRDICGWVSAMAERR